MADRTPYILWPGVQQPISVSYTLSHGISPGVASLSLVPQDPTSIALQGDLVIGDGAGEVRLKNCKVAALRTVGDIAGGFVWSLEILDRRWRWALGYISGVYNVPDATRDVTRPEVPEAGPFLAPAQLYIPWTMRSPRDLMTLCLEAMGERNYVINAPNPTYPLPGINWDYSNPAQCLSQLCESVGVRIVYRPNTDNVWIAPIGVGADFPDGSIPREAPGLQSPQRPDTIVCVGAPAKFQLDWVLQAYGEEWDGSIKPIDSLSYTPRVPKGRHAVRLGGISGGDGDHVVTLITPQGPRLVASVTSVSTPVATIVDTLVGALTFSLQADDFDVVADNGPGASTTLTLTGPKSGEPFRIETQSTGAATLEWELVTQGGKKVRTWSRSAFDPGSSVGEYVPGLDQLVGTNRLTLIEAQNLASKSVWRYYKILPTRVTGKILFGNGNQFIPGYGQLERIQHVVFLNEQINQIQPVKEDEQIMNAGGQLIVRDFYDGFFKVKPARCYGAHTQSDFGLKRPGANQNAGAEDEVLTEFTIVSDRALVIFHEPVLLHDKDRQLFSQANIRLRCACHLRDPKTNQLVRYVNTYTFPGPKLGTPPAVVRHDDIEYLVRVEYEAHASPGDNSVTVSEKEVLTNIGEAAVRAAYYLDAARRKYQLVAAGERHYNGIVPVFCDGKIQQVSWVIDLEQGAETSASANSEHAIFVPQFPERIRLEYLRAANEGALPLGPNLVADLIAGKQL